MRCYIAPPVQCWCLNEWPEGNTRRRRLNRVRRNERDFRTISASLERLQLAVFLDDGTQQGCPLNRHGLYRAMSNSMFSW